jgi:hypothetical protein
MSSKAWSGTTGMLGVQRFIDDDGGYLRWLAAHHDGFVLNTERAPKPSYLVLHRACCPKITRLQRGASRWTRDYLKFLRPPS